jgi:hypothetical protein
MSDFAILLAHFTFKSKPKGAEMPKNPRFGGKLEIFSINPACERN